MLTFVTYKITVVKADDPGPIPPPGGDDTPPAPPSN